MTTEDKKQVISFDDAVAMLPDGDSVHTFRQAGHMLIGADWSRAGLLQAMAKSEIQATGPVAQGMKHGLSIEDERGILFIETKESQ